MPEGRRIIGLLVAALLAATPLTPGWSDDDDDDHAAEAALARGLARPVHELLQRVRAGFTGTVLKIELDREDESDALWVYEVKLLTPKGDVLELAYDARTLDLMGLEGRYRDFEDD